MVKLTEMLQERFKKKEKPKMSELVEKASAGELTPFSGVFGNPRCGEKEHKEIDTILNKYLKDPFYSIQEDLSLLLNITAEVKAISNQAALLHGERIKRAQEILKKYKEGAFTAWLLVTYGNRQTPYNFLLYFEFYQKLPKILHSKAESMPRQAIYTLASREGSFEKKEEIVRNYQGETKVEVISLIRSHFPLAQDDRRRADVATQSIKQLEHLAKLFKETKVKFLPHQKSDVLKLLENIRSYL